MREVDPKTTNRAMSYEYYIDAPMPMVTIFKTMDVTHLVRLAKKGYSFNMLMCWCIVRAAQSVSEFYLLPVGKKLMQYDSLGVNVIVKNKRGELSTCDIPFCGELDEFARIYSELTERCRDSCENYELPDCMIVGTSALVHYDLDGVANFYSGIFNNPFLIWSKYRRHWLKTELKLSFQFHHVQMDGEQACRFLENLQECMNR